MGILNPAAVFSSHMVIQRGKNINVWGTCCDGREITVEFMGNKVTAPVRTHEWKAVLPAVNEYGEGYTMTISDGIETVVFDDIAVGEVWLAGGQSNMELELQNSLDGREHLKSCADSNVRFYYTKKNAYIDDYFFFDERWNSWKRASETDSACWSAVGYHFAKKLASDLGCTVGVIGCNWGGTSASAWISRETLLTDNHTRSYVDEYDEINKDKPMEQYLRELQEYREWEAEWQPKINEYYALHPTDGNWDDAQEYAGSKSRWPEPLGPRSPFRAGGLYETMLKRVMPYTIAGVIYYQGESDDHKAEGYYKLLTMMIDEWRRGWNDDTLPFMLVQLPMFANSGEEKNTNWCLIREAQHRVHKTIANTGLAVILDKGELNNIHPMDKVPVGERLELQAMCNVYGKIPSDKAYGPVYSGCTYSDGGMLLSFEYGEGMYASDKLCGFEIAGENRKYYPAAAEIRGNNVFVSSEEVKSPVYARYCWVNYGEVTLFGANGIPAAPFRTSRDDV
ncbi:MAG: sialate O-acetylesterase [Oscillospiraceae bacterium]|nr:sialate O-acetylesterase [Oscillospiraceae bacterium]